MITQKETLMDEQKPKMTQARQATIWRRILAVALLEVSGLPCPECGTPLALHIWPLILVVMPEKAVLKMEVKLYVRFNAYWFSDHKLKVSLAKPRARRDRADVRGGR
jgi:hypothetical protein